MGRNCNVINNGQVWSGYRVADVTPEQPPADPVKHFSPHYFSDSAIQYYGILERGTWISIVCQDYFTPLGSFLLLIAQVI